MMLYRNRSKVFVLFALMIAGSAAGAATPPGNDDAPAADMKLSTARDVFDTKELDTSTSVCENLDDFVNAKWIADNPIPADQTRWGAFNVLREKSLADQHTLVKAAADDVESDDANVDPLRAKIGTLFAAAMDTAAIEKAGLRPVEPRLKRIAGIDSRDALTDYLTRAFADGQGQVFDLDASPDYKNAENVIAYAYQGGLSLPTPDYYSGLSLIHI